MNHNRSFACGAVAAGQLYICGGNDEATVLKSVERMDLHTGSCQLHSSLQESRLGSVAVALLM